MNRIEQLEQMLKNGPAALTPGEAWDAIETVPDLLKLARAASEEHLGRPCTDLRCRVCLVLQELFREVQP